MNNKTIYTIYKITNLINNKIYIGQHITYDLENDTYYGSGTHLKHALKKYGKENFKKEIIFQYDNFEEMNNKEIELVNEAFIVRDDTYNILLGGQGNMTGMVTVKDVHGNSSQVSINDSLYLTGELVAICTGMINCIDLNTNKIVNITIDEYNKGNHESLNSGMVATIDDANNIQYVSTEYYYNNKHTLSTINNGKCYAIDKLSNVGNMINTNEYDKHLYKTATSGVGNYKDSQGNVYKQLPINDSRVISGELVDVKALQIQTPFGVFNSLSLFANKYKVNVTTLNSFLKRNNQIKKSTKILNILGFTKQEYINKTPEELGWFYIHNK